MESTGATGRWKPYPEYKDSGVEWLGDVPERWEITKVKYGFEIKLGKMLRPEPLTVLDTLEPYLRAANVYWEGIDIADIQEMWFSPWEKHQYEIGRGDLIVCEGGDVGRAAIWEGELEKCYIQNAVHRVRNKTGFLNNYLLYWLLTLKSKGYIDLLCSKATIAHFTAEKFQALDLVIPPLGEQMVIIDFLDYETGKIDTLIEKKQRLIELLQEKRTSIISQAVTQGLNPNIPMKDSGLEWFGKVPEHWGIERLKDIAFLDIEQLLDTTAPDYELIYIDISNVDSNGNIVNLQEYIFADAPSRARKRVSAGDTILSTVRTYLKAIAFIEKPPENMIVSTGFAVLHPKRGISSKFLWRLVQSEGFVDQVVAHSIGVSYPAITPSTLASLSVLVAPVEEQKEIINYLDKETAKIDLMLEKAQTAIRLLQEYRAALITAAVTGKIDVRDHTPLDVPYDL